MNIYTPGSGSHASPWLVSRFPLSRFIIPPIVKSVKVPFTAIFVRFTGQPIHVYVGAGKQYDIGIIHPGEQASYVLPSACDEITVEQILQRQPVETLDTLYADIWTATEPITYAKSAAPIKEPYDTYSVVFRKSNSVPPYRIGVAFNAGDRLPICTWWMPDKDNSLGLTDDRLLALVKVDVAIMSLSVGSRLDLDLQRIGFSKPTGGHYCASERHSMYAPFYTECRVLPTNVSAGATNQNISTILGTYGITAANSTINPPPPYEWQPMLDMSGLPLSQLPTTDDTVTKGFCLWGESETATTLLLEARSMFVEIAA